MPLLRAGHSLPRTKKYPRPPKRCAPVGPTPENLKAVERVKSFQDQYSRRVRGLKKPFLLASRLRSIPTPLRDQRHPNLAVDLMQHFEIRTGDRLRVRCGPDVGKEGIVLHKHSKWNTVALEGCNLVPTQFPARNAEPGAPRRSRLIERPIHVTNLTHIDPVTKQPTVVKLRRMLTGEYVRLSSRSGSAMPQPVPTARYHEELDYYQRNIIKKLRNPALFRVTEARLKQKEQRLPGSALDALIAALSPRPGVAAKPRATQRAPLGAQVRGGAAPLNV